MNFEINTIQAAELLQISERRIQQLAAENIIEREENNKFDARKITEQYYRFKFEGDVNKEFEKTKSKHEDIKLKLSEIKLHKLNKNLLPSGQVEASVTNMIVVFRNKVLGIPSKLAPKLVGIKNLTQISTILEAELVQCLQELSKTDIQQIVPEDDDKDDKTDS